MQPDFATLKPVENEQPDFATLKPVEATPSPFAAKPPEEQNLAQKIISDPVKTLIVRPGVRFGQLIGTGVAKLAGVPQEKIDEALSQGVNLDLTLPKRQFGIPDFNIGLGNIFIEPQKKIGEGGVKQIAGEALQSASYLTTGAKAAKTISSIAKGELLKPIVSGIAVGAQGGALQGAGMSLAEDESAYEVAKSTLGGAAIGGALGGILGTAGGVTSRLTRYGKKVSSEEGAISELSDRYRTLLNIGKRQTQIQERSGKDVADFIAREFRDEPIFRLNGEGKLDTTDAVESLKLKYGAEESLFDDMLAGEYKFNSIEEIRQKMLERARSNFKGTDQARAINHVNREMDAYKKQFSKPGFVNESGEPILSLEDQNIIKRDLWKKSKKKFNSTNAENLFADFNYQMGNVLKNHIEDNATGPVKDLNSRLGDYANAIRILEQRNGSTVGGGWMARQFARVTGAVVGAHVGDLPGGIAGTITADKLAEFMLDPNYSTFFIRKMVAKLPEKEQAKVLGEAQDIISERLSERVRTKLLPPPSFVPAGPKSAPKQGGAQVIPAKKGEVTVNPKTGKFQTSYLSGEKTALPNQSSNIEPIINPNSADNINANNSIIPAELQPLAEEARKYKSAEEFVKAQINAYHGTSANFEAFDNSMKGTITGAESAKGAVWFTDDPAVAKAYSVYAAEDGVINKLMEQATKAKKVAQKSGLESDWKKYDALTQEMEKLDTYDANLQRRNTQANVKEAVVKGDFYTVDAKGKSPQELSADGNIDSWLNQQLDRARKLGKDGVVFKNLDDAVGLYDKPSTHYAIFDSKNIQTKSQLTDFYNKVVGKKK